MIIVEHVEPVVGRQQGHGLGRGLGKKLRGRAAGARYDRGRREHYAGNYSHIYFLFLRGLNSLLPFGAFAALSLREDARA